MSDIIIRNLNDEVHKALKHIAVDRSTTLTDVIKNILLDFVVEVKKAGNQNAQI